MATEPSPKVSDIMLSPSRAAEVEQRFAALQDSHRLAIHMAEEEFEPFYSHSTIGKLSEFEASSIDDALKRGRPRLFSLSLLPSRKSGFSMLPYEVKPSQMNSYGYLFDLSQVGKTPPRVVRVSHENISSLEDMDSKDFNFTALARPFEPYHNQTHRNFKDLLCEFYREIANFHERVMSTSEALRNEHAFDAQIQRWRDGVCKAVGTRGEELTNQQLDMLGMYFEKYPERFDNIGGAWNDGIARHNEILAACHQSHISAIVVPSLYDPNYELSKPLCDTLARFQAAIAGLEHLKRGIDVPAMVYDVNDISGNKPMHYVGQGEVELRKAAQEALSQITPRDMAMLERTHSDSYSALDCMAQQYLDRNIRVGASSEAARGA